MVFTIQLPPNLTTEELELKEAYDKLKKLRKAVAGLKAARHSESVARQASKRPRVQSEDATKEAKRLVKAGAMTIAKVEEKHTFKRANVLDRKLKNHNKEGSSSSFRRTNSETGTGNEEEASSSHSGWKCNRQSSFGPGDGFRSSETVSASSDDESNVRSSEIYIRGIDLTEEIVKQHFESFGDIQRVKVDEGKRAAYVTYSNCKEAANAIKQTNGSMVNGMTVRVSVARSNSTNALPTPNAGNNNSRDSWSNMASNAAKPDAQPEKRSMVVYNDSDLF